MKLVYLVKNDEAKDKFLDEELPDGVKRDAAATYEANGGKLYVLSFSTRGTTISGARALAKLRRKLRDNADARLLVDDASLKFANVLYPLLANYERKLRRVLILATYAERDNFNDSLVGSLEKLTLSQLGEQLFYDRSFQDAIKHMTCKSKEPFTKEDISKYIAGLKEHTVWTRLFGDESLSSVRINYSELCDIRNKVMHQRLITEKDYDHARSMLRTSINELDTYADKVLADVNYPMLHAKRAADAAKLIKDNYESMLQSLGDSLERFSSLEHLVQNITSKIDTSVFESLATQMAGIQETLAGNQALMSSIRSLSETFSTPPIPEITSQLENTTQFSNMQKLLSDNTLSTFKDRISSVDSSMLQVSTLPSIDTSSFTSDGRINVLSNDGKTIKGNILERGPEDEDTQANLTSEQ